MTSIDKLIAVAEAEIGYLEKKSNKDLDSKTANAGSANYTKYNRDLKKWTGVGSLNAQWCQAFVDWVFITAFGLEGAKKLIYTWTNYTPTGSNAFKKRDRYIKRGKGKPKRGDVIYFYSTAKGRIGHVGIVYKVTSSKVYTIEGNTSGASTLVTNGGGVKKKSYKLTSTYIDGYGRVDYTALDGVENPATAPAASTPMPATHLGDRLLRNYTEGEDVRELQLALISLGYSCGPDGADGEFGDNTEKAVRAFQKAHGCDVDGEYGPETHKALTAALEAKTAKPTNYRYVRIAEGKKCFIRQGPGTQYKEIATAHSGDKYPYQGVTFDNGWHLIEYKNQNACVSGKYGKLVE